MCLCTIYTCIASRWLFFLNNSSDVYKNKSTGFVLFCFCMHCLHGFLFIQIVLIPNISNEDYFLKNNQPLANKNSSFSFSTFSLLLCRHCFWESVKAKPFFLPCLYEGAIPDICIPLHMQKIPQLSSSTCHRHIVLRMAAERKSCMCVCLCVHTYTHTYMYTYIDIHIVLYK